MLYFVIPAQASAQVPDPDRGGFIPAEGTRLRFSPRLDALIQRRDVIATPVDDTPPLPPSAPIDPNADTLALRQKGVVRDYLLAEIEAFLVSAGRPVMQAIAAAAAGQPAGGGGGLSPGANLSDLADKAAARANLGLRERTDALTVGSDGSLSSLAQTPNGVGFELAVNGLVYRSVGASPAFAVSARIVIWSTVNAGYALDPSDDVTATYTY